MMNTKTIPENVLRGIVVALNSNAPHLLGIIKELVHNNDTDGPPPGIGQSAYGKLTGSIPLEQGREVSDALHEIQQVHGFGATFDGWSISLLVQQWDDFVSPILLPPQ